MDYKKLRPLPKTNTFKNRRQMKEVGGGGPGGQAGPWGVDARAYKGNSWIIQMPVDQKNDPLEHNEIGSPGELWIIEASVGDQKLL